ncbi:MAG TPA: peptidase T [bacterium]|nr:peptidase T [bacterium]
MQNKMLERFFWYVKMDTQSSEDAGDNYPSTEKQKELSGLLVEELKGMGIKDAEMDRYGYVTATLPGNLPSDQLDRVPVIGFLAHVDTSPEVSGKNVLPVVHSHYQGGDIVLPGDKTQVITEKDNPELKKYIGSDIVTSDGTTLLGADNKAGIAEIMTMLEYFLHHPEIKHGTVRVAFTPDEEVGMGTRYFDVKKFGADFAYTVDGEKAGEIENETFNAATAVYTIRGVNLHPGYAKGRMVNAIRAAGELIKSLEADPSPETTEKKEGYLHPYVLQGGVEEVTLKVLIRDFEEKGMDEKADRLELLGKQTAQKFPGADIELKITQSYRNMRYKLDEAPRAVEYALEAVKKTGLNPRLHSIRGGTDGARLCYEGLPTPNIFTGGMNFHSKLEWIPVEAMDRALQTLINLVQIWTERSLDKEK